MTAMLLSCPALSIKKCYNYMQVMYTTLGKKVLPVLSRPDIQWSVWSVFRTGHCGVFEGFLQSLQGNAEPFQCTRYWWFIVIKLQHVLGQQTCCDSVGSNEVHVMETLSLSWYVYWGSGYFQAFKQASFSVGALISYSVVFKRKAVLFTTYAYALVCESVQLFGCNIRRRMWGFRARQESEIVRNCS
jgi:hypothetical protein